MLTQDRLKELLTYDSETGIFTRRVGTSSNAKEGRLAGGLDGLGYIRIRLDGARYRSHILAWLYVYGSFPTDHIDHINRSRSDNRISNLRIATKSQNAANRTALSNNTSGFKGVSWYKTGAKWKAQICFRGSNRHIGYFKKIEDAKAAYDQAAVALFGEYARSA